MKARRHWACPLGYSRPCTFKCGDKSFVLGIVAINVAELCGPYCMFAEVLATGEDFEMVWILLVAAATAFATATAT